RLSGVTHGLFQLAARLGRGARAAYIPLSVLAGLLISVGLAIVDYKGFRHLLRVPRADAVVMLVVLFATVFGNLIYAVAAGVMLSSLLFMKKAGDLSEERSRVEKLEPEEAWPDESPLAGRKSVYVKHLYGPLFFGFSSGFRDLAEKLPEEIETLIVRMERVPYMDQSGLYSLEDALLQLRQRGKEVVLTGVQPQPEDMLRSLGIIPELISEEQLRDSIEDFIG
ncbi:MAG: STAS domain-containing protein, partial [Acidobacteriota bacterium]